MRISLLAVLVTIAVAITSSCTFVERESSTGSGSDSGPAADDGSASQTESDMPVAPVSLPFMFFVGDTQVGPDLRVSVPENQGMVIQYQADTAISCELSVQRSDREGVIAIGAWNGEMAQYFQEFPYGENHLFLTRGDRIYDILVVAGPPQPESTSSNGCGKTFLDLNSNARWTYETYRNDESTGQLINRVENFHLMQDGTTSLILVMERFSDEPGKVAGTIEAELTCHGESILVSQVTEVGGEMAKSTTYNDGTVYMPSVLAQDIWWERRGTMIVQEGHDSVYYDVIERFRCTGRENISIAAGEFEAYRVEYTIEQVSWAESVSFSGVSWYVAGLGRVLNDADVSGSPRVELVSYENVGPKQ